MARQKKDAREEIVPAIGVLILFGFFFIPQFHSYLKVVSVLFLLGLSAFLGCRFWKRRNSEHHLNSSEPDSFFAKAQPDHQHDSTLSEQLRAIDWFQFEKLIEAVYRSKNYKVERVDGATPEGGIDLIVENPATRFVVQCKQWKSWKVGVQQIREFLGALADVGVRKGVFITLQGYTEEAKELAGKHGIRILDEAAVLKLLEEVNWKYNSAILATLVEADKRCAKCGSPIALRTATKGKNIGEQFWGCSTYPRCKFVLNIQS